MLCHFAECFFFGGKTVFPGALNWEKSAVNEEGRTHRWRRDSRLLGPTHIHPPPSGLSTRPSRRPLIPPRKSLPFLGSVAVASRPRAPAICWRSAELCRLRADPTSRQLRASASALQSRGMRGRRRRETDFLTQE